MPRLLGHERLHRLGRLALGCGRRIDGLPLHSPDAVTFAFCDINLITGRTFAQSRFRDLPGFAADVVTDTLHLCAGEWDVLVEDGEAYDFTGYRDAYMIPSAVRQTCSSCSGESVAWRGVRCSECHNHGSYVVMPESAMAPRPCAAETTLVVVA